MERVRAAWVAAKRSTEEQDQRTASNFFKYLDHDSERIADPDLHGLRHTGITLVVRPAGLKVGQIWAHRPTPVLTAKSANIDETDEAIALATLTKTLADTDGIDRSRGRQKPRRVQDNEEIKTGWISRSLNDKTLVK